MSKSQKYWEERFKQLEEASNNRGHEALMRIEPSFDEAQQRIQKEIEAWYGRYATNNGVTMQEAKKQLTTREMKEFRWDVNEYIKYGKENALNQQWMKELENASARVHISRLEALKLRTQQYAEKAFGNELDELDSMARRVFTEDYYHSCFEVQKGWNIGWELGQIDERKLDAIVSKPWAADGKNFSDRIWNSKVQLVDELHKQLTQTCILGKAPDDAIKAISKKFGTSKSQAGRLVMTEQAYFHSVAQQNAFNDLDVEEYEIVATLDDSTSETCQEMDGKHFPMNEYKAGVTAPPFHVWCRSVTIPYFEDNYTGERAARNGDGKTYYVPDDMTYPEWKEYYVDRTKDPDKWERKYKPPKEAPKQRGMKEIEFIPAKTIAEAEEYAKRFVENGGMIMYGKKRVNYSGITVEMANNVNRQLTQLYGNYELKPLSSIEVFGKGQKSYWSKHSGAPLVTTNFGNLMINKEICKSEKTISKYILDGKESFNFVMSNMGRLSGSKLKLAQAYKEAGRSLVGNTFDDMITHEIGHHLSYMPSVNKEIVEVLKSSDWGEYAKHISGYANHSTSEYIAESWTAYIKGEIDIIDPELTRIFDGLRKDDVEDIFEDAFELTDDERAWIDELIEEEDEISPKKQFLKDISEAKSISEINDISTAYFQQKDGCNIEVISMKDVDLQAAKDMMIKLDDMDDRFVSKAKSIRARSMRDAFSGQCSPTMESLHRCIDEDDANLLVSDITLNHHYLNSEKIIRSEFQLNHREGLITQCARVDESAMNVVTLVHEYGHSILAGKASEILIQNGVENRTFMACKRLYRQHMKQVRDMQREIREIQQQFAGQPDGLRKGVAAAKEKQDALNAISVSKYSRESVGEFIAECFCDVECSSHPKEISLKVYAELVKGYGK